MPLNPRHSSFPSSASHLFRHLHESGALRKNPLVEHFFSAPDGIVSSAHADRATLERVHTLVREAAEHCRDADLAEGREERARRQYALVTEHALGRRPVRDVAKMLGISPQQCYRERAEVGQRVARYIAQHDVATTQQLPDLDAFGLLLECTRRGAAYRDASVALQQCDNVVASASSPAQKVEALRMSGLVAIGFGKVERAEAARAEAERWTQSLGPGDARDREIARACIDLLECDLAYHRADSATALRCTQRATERLERIQHDAPARVRELYVESLYELAAAFWNLGRLPDAYASMLRADSTVKHDRVVSAPLRARVAVGLWKSRNHLLTSLESWCPSSRRIEGLAAAFEASRGAGLLVEAADALVALIQCYAFAGDDAHALRAARLGAVLASQHSSARMRGQIAMQIAFAMLGSHHWAFGLSLLNAHDAAGYDGYHREAAAYVRAEHAFRRHALDDALRLVGAPSDADAYPALAVKRQVIAAAAAHRLERSNEARAFVDQAVPAAERLGSAPILRDAYAVAASVTGDSRLRRNAGEVSRLLTA